MTESHKLVNLNNQISKFIVSITKSKYIDQDAGHGLRPNHYHCVESRSSISSTIWLYPTSSWVSMDMNTSEQNVTAGTILMPGLVDLQKFMFSDRYHLTASALAQVCPLMTVLMLWTTSFNRCRASLLSLVLNAFLKVRVVYFKAEFTISGTFQRSTCSAGATPTCTPYTISFLGVEGPFLEEVGPFMVFWCNCCLAGCVIAFSQLLKRFSSLIARLIALQ